MSTFKERKAQRTKRFLSTSGKKLVPCGCCSGTGYYSGGHCGWCEGTGKVREK